MPDKKYQVEWKPCYHNGVLSNEKFKQIVNSPEISDSIDQLIDEKGNIIENLDVSNIGVCKKTANELWNINADDKIYVGIRPVPIGNFMMFWFILQGEYIGIGYWPDGQWIPKSHEGDAPR